MRSFGKLIIMELDEGCNGVIHGWQLHESHLPILREKFKCLDGDADVVEGLSEVLLLHAAGDVAEVQRGAGRVDVLVVLAPRLLEPVQPGVGVVLRQTRVRLPVLWQLKQERGRN